MDILNNGVSFNADNAASLTEAAFTRQHAHLWPDVSHEERSVRLAQVQEQAKELMGYIDFETISHESEDPIEQIGTPEPTGHHDTGSTEEAGGNATAEPGTTVSEWPNLDRE